MSERVTLDWFMNMKPDGTVELLDGAHNVVARFYSRASNDLEEQNAKLRELVAEMFNACPMCVNCAHNHLTVGWYDRMRELGVEVE